MAEPLAGRAEADAHHLAENVMHFGRVLRDAGLRIGSDRIALALQALQQGGLASRRDFKATLAACLLDRADHRLLFDQAFHIFWQDPDLMGRVMAMMLPSVESRAEGRSGTPPAQNRRLAEALFPRAAELPQAAPPPEQRIELDAALSFSQREQLRQRDFDTMTVEEWAAARLQLRRLQPLFPRLLTRRRQPAAHGTVAWRASLRTLGRGPGLAIRHEAPRERVAPLIILADISGSMSRYSRVLLHLAHGLMNPAPSACSAGPRPRISCHVFGTRLTPITRALRQRDPDQALAAVSRQVQDWSGGTRISACLHEFNQRWARRELRSDATVLLITDGLERGDEDDGVAGRPDLAAEARRLRLSCRRLIWLNPLLRYQGFEPRAAGVRALLPEVSLHLPVHNLASLEQLAAILSERTP
ncbi:VWA domain-containing protein [Paucibacter sp. APW11]|uniref:VWA domain-containing protein n=1 Tax=Roseateles aquae TaxID=3077235 RepID=A0ABU3PIW8_9BURK|nr:VWA domain-containing protein [Paucibacter sp. APW11]MDT9002390.1 VWA domain-containing protein [Paucibacter sp. APW11]